MMNKNMNYIASSRGLSLVELMVALALGMVISIGIFEIFRSTRVTYQLDEGLARAQENGRFAMEFLSQDIRHAGHLGCRRNAKIFSTLVGSNLLLPVSSVTAFEYTQTPTGPGDTYSAATTVPNNTTTGWTPAFPSTFTQVTNGALPGTDVIADQRLVPNPMPLISRFVD
jgi:type IV pilus assembly protein PilW